MNTVGVMGKGVALGFKKRYPEMFKRYQKACEEKRLNIGDLMLFESIAFPRLGCGNGALRWEDVQPLMEKYLKSLPIKIYIYVNDYKETIPEHLSEDLMEKWLAHEPQSIGKQPP